jgi:hypothetical protein
MKLLDHNSRWLALCGVLLAAALGSPAFAVAPYVAPGFSVTTLTSLGTNNGAVAYAPDGTLYVVHGSFFSPSSTIDVVNPNGTLGTPLVVQNATFASIGGAAWDPVANKLLITDSDNGNFLYSVPVTGAPSGGHINVSASTLLSDPTGAVVPFISQVAVRPSTGDIYVSDAPFGTATILQIDRTTGQAHGVLQANQDFTAGIGFDSLGHMIYQSGAFNFSGGPPTANVSQALLSGSGNTTTSGSPQLLSSTVGSFDLAVTLGNHVLITGNVPQSSNGVEPYTFGLFQPDLATNSTHSLVTFPTASSGDFGASLSYLPGTTNFNPFSGVAGGRVALVLSDFSGVATGTPSSNVVMIVAPGPEPTTRSLLALGLGSLFVWRRFGAAVRRQPLGG